MTDKNQNVSAPTPPPTTSATEAQKKDGGDNEPTTLVRPRLAEHFSMRSILLIILSPQAPLLPIWNATLNHP